MGERQVEYRQGVIIYPLEVAYERPLLPLDSSGKNGQK